MHFLYSFYRARWSQTNAPLTGNQRRALQRALMPDERLKRMRNLGRYRTALLARSQVSSGGTGRGTSRRGRACRRGTKKTVARAGEVGGLFRTRLVPEAGCALPQRLISNVQKIHMLVKRTDSCRLLCLSQLHGMRFRISVSIRQPLPSFYGLLQRFWAAICVYKTGGHRPACAVGNDCLD